MRPARLACAIALLATLAAASTLGQELADSNDHFLVIERASLDLVSRPDVSRLQTRYDIRPAEPTGGPGCGSGRIMLDAIGGSFEFIEDFQDTGCGQGSLLLQVPPGATTLEVNFTADRQVQEISQANPPQAMLQRFLLFGPHGALLAQADYFDSQQGSAAAQGFLYQLPLAEDFGQVTVAWMFADDGADFAPGVAPPTPALQRLRAEVSNISFAWPGSPLPLPGVVQGPETVQGEERVAWAHLLVNASVPADLLGPGNSTALRLSVRTHAELVGVQGPKGSLQDESYNVSLGGDAVAIELPPDLMAAAGPGHYVFDFLSARALAPAPVPPAPVRIVWFYAIMLLAPLAAAVLATQHSTAFVREASGRYVRSARLVLAGVVGVTLYYALVALYSLIVVGWREMSQLPFSPAAVLLYVQLFLVAAILLLAAFLGTRLLTRNMRRDLSERQAQEEQLRRSNEELERFAYVASHDLQEPLRKVAGFTALLQRRYKGRLDKDADEMIDYAVDGATRMQALIRDILAFSRINSSQLDLQVVDTGALMDLVASDLDPLLRETKAVVAWRGLPTVRADPGQLRQVFQNLVENGIKYRSPKRRPRIEVSAVDNGSMWAFRVADNGIGIPPDKASEVFGIFRRLHGREVPGTGIGLAIVKKAIERHGGSIRVEPRPGGGSVFIFTLPYGTLEDGAVQS